MPAPPPAVAPSEDISIVHRVAIPSPATHLVEVELTLAARPGTVLPPSLVVFMPVWTPGSYLVREYARHLEGLRADEPAVAHKIRKNAWRIDTRGAAEVRVRYQVYAAELTVRTSHVDDSHAFLVPAALLLGVEDHLHAPLSVEIVSRDGWRVVSPLEVEPRGGASPEGVVRLRAPNFDALVDSPIEIGNPTERTFDVLGVPHRYAVSSQHADDDLRRLVDDTKTIIETEAALFGGSLPYTRYDLLLRVSPRGRGGLEHRSSAALIAPPASFSTREGYLDLLSLVAHEVFHAWNVKRIRPEGLTPYRYEEECYTRLLWWFEGATSYYDWRVLSLARLATADEYLDHLAGEIAYLDQTHGRLVQSLEDASFDAWIKLYRPDENSANSSVSYYRKGEVVCALLDLEIRARTAGAASLDTVLRHLWEGYGARERPVPEDGMQTIFETATKVPLGDLFDAWVRGAGEIDCARVLAYVGLAVERTSRADAPRASLGVRVRAEGSRTLVATVQRHSAAWNAGVDPGDEILAIGGARVEANGVDAALRERTPGEQVEVVVARDGRLRMKLVTLDAAKPDRVKLVPVRDATAAARDAFAAWLGQPFPTARQRVGA